jgi:subtilisin family serine protease
MFKSNGWAFRSLAECATKSLRALLALFLVAVLCLATSVGRGMQVVDEGTDLWLSYRIAPGVKPETLKLLADATVPDSQSLKPGYSIKFVLKLKYGYVNQYLQDLFKRYNPTITTDLVEKDTDVLLPAAPFWQFDVKTVAAAKTTLYGEVAIESGAKNDEQLAKTVEDFRKYNRGVSGIEALSVGRTIALPVITRFGVYRLRPEFAAQYEDLLSKLRADEKTLSADIGAATLVPSVPNKRPVDPIVETGDKPPSYPFGAFTDSTFPIDELRKTNQVIVAVIDSGIWLKPDIAHPFPFWQNPGEKDQTLHDDDDDNQFDDDVIGCTVFDRTAEPNDDSTNSHGTHVAGIATGRLLSDGLRQRVDQLLRLMVIKVTFPGSNNAQVGWLSEAVLYAHHSRANIINMSLEGLDSHGLKDAIHRSDNQLFVVAAGNGGIDLALASSKVYPAKYAKEMTNVISVAAHDEDGKLIQESNYGSEYVDLAAPGHKIKSVVQEGNNDELSGTSQAAPLVTLTAALIYSQGLTDPIQIKQRILNSTDYVAEYNNIRSQGKLNIAKAVSIYHDVIELANHQLKIGRIITPRSIILENGGVFEEKDMSLVKRIILNYVTEPGKTTIRISLAKKTLFADKMLNQEGKISTIRIKLLNGQCEDIPLSQIIEIIPRTIQTTDSDKCS